MTVHADISRRSDLVGIALVITSAVAFSAKAIFVKLAYGDVETTVSVDPVTLLTMRMGLALPLFALIGWWSSRKAEYSLNQRDWLLLGGIGLMGYYGASLLDFWGLMFVSAALERLILFLNPTFVVIISALAIGYRIQALDIFALVVSYAGILLAFTHDLNINREHVLLGGTLVLMSAILYAGYLVSAGQIIKRVGALRFAAYASMVSTAAIVLHFLATREVSVIISQSPRVWTLSICMSLISTVLPILMMAEGIRRVGPSNAAMMSSIGPIATIFMGNAFLGERVTSIQLIGAALVTVGVLAISLKKK